ncbi:MAG: nicotinamide-nucleotide amidohydrolase family protein [Thermotogota bacterium]
MKVSILATGNEIVEKKVEETNSNFIVENILKFGFDIQYILSIKDNYENFENSLNFLSKSSDIIFIIGGLGPTVDDITLESIANFFDLEMIENRKVKEKIINYHKDKGKISNEGLKRQSRVIKNAEIVYNDFGTAPGQIIKHNKKFIFLLPGPPKEFKSVFNKVLKTCDLFKNANEENKNLFFYNVTEMDLTYKLEEYGINKNYGIYIIKNLGLRLDIKKDEKLIEYLKESYNNKFLGESSLIESFFEYLISKNIKLSVAESCTGGKLADYIISKSGASKFFEGSFVTYSNDLKSKILKVKTETLEKNGAVSEKCVSEMVNNLKIITNTDIAISISGIAGPTGGTKEKPVGTVYFGFIIDDKEYIVKKIFKGNREDIRQRSVYYSLWKVLDLLQTTGRLSNE